MRSFESGGDALALHFLEGAETGNRTCGAGRGGPNIFRKILRLEEVARDSRSAAVGARENHGALESVAKFAEVARSGIGRSHSAGRITQLRCWASVNGGTG